MPNLHTCHSITEWSGFAAQQAARSTVSTGGADGCAPILTSQHVEGLESLAQHAEDGRGNVVALSAPPQVVPGRGVSPQQLDVNGADDPAALSGPLHIVAQSDRCASSPQHAADGIGAKGTFVTPPQVAPQSDGGATSPQQAAAASGAGEAATWAVPPQAASQAEGGASPLQQTVASPQHATGRGTSSADCTIIASMFCSRVKLTRAFDVWRFDDASTSLPRATSPSRIATDSKGGSPKPAMRWR